jgi:hypothetical protein
MSHCVNDVIKGTRPHSHTTAAILFDVIEIPSNDSYYHLCLVLSFVLASFVKPDVVGGKVCELYMLKIANIELHVI